MSQLRLAGVLLFGMSLLACGGARGSDRDARAARGDRAQGEARAGELKASIDNINGEVTKRNDGVEKKLGEALAIAAGEAAPTGSKKAASVATMIKDLRAAGIATTVTTPADFQQGFFLPDPKALSAYAKKNRKAPDPKVVTEFTDFINSVSVISFLSFTANENALTMHLQTLQVGAAIAGNEKRTNRPTSPEDLALLRATIAQERRAEQLAAVATGLAAATSAAIGSTKDPQGLDEVVTGLKGAVPVKGEASDEDAKTYLAGLDAGLGDARARYDGMLQQSYGASYSRSTMKSIVDQVFSAAERDLGQKSLADERRAHDEKHPPKTGDGSGGSLADRAIATARGLLPADGPLRKGLDTFDALRKGDMKGAITSAMGFVPPGPVKSAIGLALKFF